MTSEEFNNLIKNSRITHAESTKAWKIFKQKTPQQAVDYVQKILEKRVEFQTSVKLRDKAVPYHIWGEEYIDSGALDQMQ